MLANPDARWMKRRRRVSEASLSPDHAVQDHDNVDNGDDDDNDGVQHMEAKANAGLTASPLSSSRAFLSWKSVI